MRVLSENRISVLGQLLEDAGWIKNVEIDGWLAPPHLREAIAMQAGRGHLRLDRTIMAQTQYDMATFRGAH